MMFPNLKIGDKVLRHHEKIIISGGWGTGLSVRVTIEETVARVTAKQAVTESGLRFNLVDGTIHGIGGGTRVCMYPLGYVDKYAGNAIAARPMEPTTPARLAELDASAKDVHRFESVLSRFSRNERKIIKHVLQVHGIAEGSAILRELANRFHALMEGFKP